VTGELQVAEGARHGYTLPANHGLFLRQMDGANFMTEESESKLKQRDVEGLKINYYEDGSGPDLVLLHGMFGDYLDWEPVLGLLAAKFHIVALDLPGFGASGKPDVIYTGEFFVDRLDEFFGALELREIVLAGNSFGGQIAMLYALRHPEKVSQMVLVDSGGFREVPQSERAMARTILSRENLLGMQAGMIPLIFSKVFVKESAEKERYLAKQTAKLKMADYPEYVRAVVQSIELSMATNLLAELSKIACPVVLLAGKEDSVVPPEQAEEAARRLPQATLQIMEGCGHMPQMEEPEEFARLVGDHIFKKR
jgi:pimeloyl-ACP methyl ester carboxylesterase